MNKYVFYGLLILFAIIIGVILFKWSSGPKIAPNNKLPINLNKDDDEDEENYSNSSDVPVNYNQQQLMLNKQEETKEGSNEETK